MKIHLKLLIAATVVIATTAYMAYLGASTSWQYYVTADECLANAPSLTGRPVRVSGRVAPGSLEVSTRDSQAKFALAAPAGLLRVVCQGPLPDNLAEDIDVVVEGRLGEDGVLRGTRLLTRCASKYESMPAGQAKAGAKEAP